MDKCKTEGCSNSEYCKGVCKTCYHRGYAKAKNSEVSDNPKRKCCVEGCSKLKYAKGYCTNHYADLKRNSEAAVLGNKQCKIPGCEKGHSGKGFCQKHYRTSVEVNKRPGTRFTQSKYKAAKQGLEWSIGLEDYKNLIRQNCFYCDDAVSETGKGLDRIDNDKGYTLDNVLPCCGNCNYLRGYRLTVTEMQNVVRLLQSTRNKDKIWS